jgi:LPPG:FO 2-phospho-L-lactate transferase
LEAIESADAVIIAPSNPIASIMPIICIEKIAEAMRNRERRIAISPIVRGRAVKGPAAQMMADLGMEPSPVGVANIYRGLVDAIVIDSRDADLSARVESETGIRPFIADTMMVSADAKRRLAEFTLRSIINM